MPVVVPTAAPAAAPRESAQSHPGARLRRPRKGLPGPGHAGIRWRVASGGWVRPRGRGGMGHDVHRGSRDVQCRRTAGNVAWSATGR